MTSHNSDRHRPVMSETMRPTVIASVKELARRDNLSASMNRRTNKKNREN